ncbi:hypothetical protein BC940DRAFT_17332 [Gongronella butleri]|nr:hypothetical protein BC940DRAFT_17332 [Gongronella butleri]
MYNSGAAQAAPSNHSPSGGLRLTFITAADQSKFEDLFRRATATSGGRHISAAGVRDILARSRLDNDSLAKIWDMSSIARGPTLSFPEFAVAMYLTSNKLTGKALPAQLPPQVREEAEIAMATLASTEPTTTTSLIDTNPTPPPQVQMPMMTGYPMQQPQQPMMTGYPLQQQQQQQPMMTGYPSARPQQPMMTGYVAPQPQMPMMTGYQAPGLQLPMATGRPLHTAKARIQNNDFASKMMPNQSIKQNLLAPALGTHQVDAISWKISPEEKQRYRAIFEAWAAGSGYLSGDQARQVFLQSGVSEQDLMKIWTLADRDNRGSLDVDEFAIAMHLIYRKLNNFDVPSVLPPELAPPTSVLKKFVIGHRPSATASQPVHNSSSTLPASQQQHRDDFEEEDDGHGRGYTSQARRPPGTRRVASSSRYNDDDAAAIDELKLQIRDAKGKLDSVMARSKQDKAVAATANKYSLEELKDHIRKTQDQLGRAFRGNASTAAYFRNSDALLELLEEQATLQDELQYLCNRDIPVLARQLRSAATELRDAKVRDARRHDGGQDFNAFLQATGPGGTVTESDRVRAKAKAMMAARKIGTSSAKDANVELRRAEDEKTAYDRLADEAERDMERSREQLRDLAGDLRYLDKIRETAWVDDKKRFERGQDMSYDLRRFIDTLERDAPISANAPLSSSSSYTRTSPAPASASPTISSPSSAYASPSTTTRSPSTPSKPRTAEEIKKEAERRVQERLDALRRKREGASPSPAAKSPVSSSAPAAQVDHEEQAAQQRLRDAELEAQAKLREREEEDARRRQQEEDAAQQRRLDEERAQQERADRERAEQERRQKEEEDERRHEEELEQRRKAVVQQEEEARRARQAAIDEANEAAAKEEEKEQEKQAIPPPPPPPGPPAEEPADAFSTAATNPFAKLQQQQQEQQNEQKDEPMSPTGIPASTSRADKRVSYNPFAAFSAFSATSRKDIKDDSSSDDDDGWDEDDDQDSDNDIPAAGSAKNLADKLFDAMSMRQVRRRPPSRPRRAWPSNIPRIRQLAMCPRLLLPHQALPSRLP